MSELKSPTLLNVSVKQGGVDMKDGGRCWREGRFWRKLALAFQGEGQEGDREQSLGEGKEAGLREGKQVVASTLAACAREQEEGCWHEQVSCRRGEIVGVRGFACLEDTREKWLSRQ